MARMLELADQEFKTTMSNMGFPVAEMAVMVKQTACMNSWTT